MHLITENEFKKLETFDSIYFCCKLYFDVDHTQNYSVFQTAYRYFKTVSINNSNTLSWKSKGLSNESIKPSSTFNKMLNFSLDYVVTNEKVKFNGDYLKQQKVTFNHGKIVNIYIDWKIDDYHNVSSYPTQENCLFGAAKLITHIDVDLFKYSVYGIGFDRKSVFSIGDEIGRNVIIFRVDMISSSFTCNKKNTP